jgi:hypothetical protein
MRVIIEEINANECSDPQAPFRQNLQLLYENYAPNFTTQVATTGNSMAMNEKHT